MANSRDFTGKNRKFTGTKGVTVPKGTTGQRVGGESGELRFNTTTELMEYYDGNQWKPIDAPPTISSISTSDATGSNTVLNADGSTLYTITITGGNFGIGANVKFIGNTGTEYTAGNINRVSGSTITCTTVSNMGTADDPYDVQVINASGLSALLDNAISFSALPVFVSAAGSLGPVFDTAATSKNCSATDAEGDTITYSIVSGSLPGSGLSLSSSTGLITGTLSGTPSLGVYPFTVRAATAEGIVERQFSVTVTALPTGGTVTTSGNFRIHTFTSSGTFANTIPSLNVQYLVIAGGGGSGRQHGGGGGAGGYRNSVPGETSGDNSSAESTLTLSSGDKTVTIGAGGAGSTGAQVRGASGTNSVFDSITSTGGGGGGSYHTNVNAGGNGLSGGSGGGGGSIESGNSGSGYGNSGGAGTAQQGFAGGDSAYSGAGGGGASELGEDGSGASPAGDAGDGGAGLSSSIDGTSTGRAGGGAGGSYGGSNQTSGSRGLATDGGGNGGWGAEGGTNGTTNTGGGAGGGGVEGNGASTGGSGIVIVRYQL